MGNKVRAAAASAMALGMLALAGCATQPVPISIADAIPTGTLSPPAPVLPRPTPPEGVAETFTTPPRLPNGAYATINSNIGADETVWHLRSALNVAALGCRGAENSTIATSYNSMLSADAKVLLAAYVAARAHYKASFGQGWETQWDQQSTRVYNFFSQSAGHEHFCIAAKAVADQVATVPSPALATFAAAVLPRLEQPFTDFYRAFDEYKVALADWQSRYGGVAPALATAGPMMASAATVTTPVYLAPAAPSVVAEAPASQPRLQYAPVGDAAGTR